MIQKQFPPAIASKLGYYVYRLIDPRNGETFYVGKGKGNRVFKHAAGEIAVAKDDLTDKTRRIREIKLAGFEVAHIIHRHGLDEKTAFEVEAAVMDAYPGLTNIVAGHAAAERGAAHALEILARYQAKEAQITHKVVAIMINQTAGERSIYNSVRYAWKLKASRAEKAAYIFAVRRGLIIGVFVADRWLPVTVENFPAMDEDRPGRFGFLGREAPDAIQRRYMGKALPAQYRRKGNANPVRYINC
ncbi:MAG: LEM-3-like GIY-YIG domain-containing protein [Alphaproteobacteria bacterium]